VNVAIPGKHELAMPAQGGNGRFSASSYRELAPLSPRWLEPAARAGTQAAELDMADGTLRLSRRFRAVADRVFAAWLRPDVVRRWLLTTASRPLTTVAIDARAHGHFRGADGALTLPAYAGQFVEIAPPSRLVFRLATRDCPDVTTLVRVDIAACTIGCRLTLTHTGVPLPAVPAHRARWQGALYGLNELLEIDAD
jgi:uncharacterized protein YndB with AHSA1/START domain